MKIAIVDDRQDEREHLRTMLEYYCATHSVTADITCFTSGEELLESFKPEQFQCMFLDIYMDGIDGMETARKVYKLDPACRLIFCTTSISHAVSSYEVRAAWYLTKPFSAQRLADAMDAACKDVIRNSRSLTVHISGAELSIRFSNIHFVDCENRQARIHLRKRVLDIDEQVNDILNLLSSDERFLACNRNTAINMDQVDIMEEHDFRMKNGSCVPIRQRGRAALKKTYMEWSLRELRLEERV